MLPLLYHLLSYPQNPGGPVSRARCQPDHL